MALLGTGSVLASAAPTPADQVAAPSTQTPPGDGPLSAGAALLASQTGLSLDTATRRLSNQLLVAELRRRMFEMQPAAQSFRTEELKQATSVIVTADTKSVRDVAKYLEDQAVDLDLQRDVKVSVTPSRHDKADVSAAKDRLKKYFAESGIRATAENDEGTGRIIVTASPTEAGSDPTAKLAPKDVVGQVGDEVDIDVTEAKPKSLAGGGEALNSGCTSGFAVMDGSTSAIVTAGHCGAPNPASLTDTSGTLGGTVSLGQPEQSTCCSPDRQFQRVLRPGVADPAIVWAGSNRQRQVIRTVGAPAVGNTLCLFGVSSAKFDCGQVLSVNSMTFVVSISSAEGDSGDLFTLAVLRSA